VKSSTNLLLFTVNDHGYGLCSKEMPLARMIYSRLQNLSFLFANVLLLGEVAAIQYKGSIEELH
jgi:hypothetical protein